MPLTDTNIRHLKPREKPYKVADGGGLYVQVTPNGSKLWRCRYRFGGVEKLLSFGAYPIVSLERAREKRFQAKKLLAEGIDPRAQELADKAEKQAVTEHTFERIARELVEKLQHEGKAEVTLKKKQWLLDMAVADFGQLPIRDITPALILATLRKIEARGGLPDLTGPTEMLGSTVGL